MAAKPDGNTVNKDGKKKRSKFFTAGMIILDVIIIVAAFGAVFYFIVYNNIGGVTERHYSSIKSIPFLFISLVKLNQLSSLVETFDFITFVPTPFFLTSRFS